MSEKSEQTECMECGMLCEVNEYHPLEACILFKYDRNGENVRSRLRKIGEHFDRAADVLQEASKIYIGRHKFEKLKGGWVVTNCWTGAYPLWNEQAGKNQEYPTFFDAYNAIKEII